MNSLPDVPDANAATLEVNPSASAAKKKEKAKPKAEHSIELRLIAAGFALLCIIVAAIYTQMHFVWAILYFWLALTGSYTSYFFREKRIGWLAWLIAFGLLSVMAQFVLEIYAEFRIGRIEGLIPFIHVLCGLLTLQTFDLETRTDINISILIALGLFTCTAVLGTDLKFGFFVLLLVLLGTVMLYFEAISRTKSNQSAERATAAPVFSATARAASGISVLPILSIPALSFLFFLMLPRVDSLVDALVNYVHSFNKGPQLRLSYLPGSDANNAVGNKDKDKDKDKNKAKSGSGQFAFGENPRAPEGKDGASAPGGAANPGSKGAGKGSGNAGDPSKKGAANGAQDAGKGTGKDTGKDAGKGSGTAGGDKDKGSGGTTVVGKDGKPVKAAKGTKTGPQESATAESSETQETDDLVFRNAASAANDDQLLLYVASPETVYLRRMYFDKFDGHHWTISKHSKVADCEKMSGNYAELGGVPSLHVPAKFKTKDVVQRIVVMNSIGHVLPTADIPQSVAIGDEKITVDDYGVVRCKSELKEITNYEVISKVPVFDLDALRRVPTPEPTQEFKDKFANYLQLPEKVPTEVEAEAQRVGAGEGNWMVKAERINQYLKKHFKYSTAPFTEDPEKDVVKEFLFTKKEGACGEFSSAFALLCRLEGIPTRVVGGFAPGEYDSQKDRREVRAKDGHAWSEIYIPDAGWVPFDSTPSGTLPEPPENVNQFVASIDRSLKDMAANFSAQQMDRQFAHGKDQNYPINTQDVKTHGLKGPVANVSTPKVDLGSPKSGSGKDSSAPPMPRVENPNPDPNAQPKGFDFSDSKMRQGKQTSPWVFVLLGFGVLLVIGGGAAAFFFRAHLRRFIFRSEFPRVSKGVKPSTLVYLKLSDDLRRLKILRRPSDTAEDLERRFFETYSDDMPCHPELPSLFREFMQLYWEDRFGSSEDSAENYKQLRELGSRIHTLARTRSVEKAS